jgi:hypothetical protein
VIEDLPPLYDVPLTVRVPEALSAAYLVPGRAALPMAREAGAARVIVPRMQGHQAVVFEY